MYRGKRTKVYTKRNEIEEKKKYVLLLNLDSIDLLVIVVETLLVLDLDKHLHRVEMVLMMLDDDSVVFVKDTMA